MERFIEVALLLVALGVDETTPCDRINLMDPTENPSPTPTPSPVGNTVNPLSQIPLDGSPFVYTVKVTSRSIFTKPRQDSISPRVNEFPVKPSTDTIILVTEDKPDGFSVNGAPVDTSSSTSGTVDGKSVFLTRVPVTPSANPVIVTTPAGRDILEVFQEMEGTPDPLNPSVFEIPVNCAVSDILVPATSSVSEIVVCLNVTRGNSVNSCTRGTPRPIMFQTSSEGLKSWLIQ